VEIPPPPPAHTFCWGANAGGLPSFVSVAPPTPVTYGCDAGSSTANSLPDEVPLSHPSEPESPVAASTVWPCATIASKIKFSGATRPNSIAIGSQKPALVLTTCASSSACIAPHAARMPGGVRGTSYT